MSAAVTEQELLDELYEGSRYRQSDIYALIPDAHWTVVAEVLASLVRKGLVWRVYAGGRFEYQLLSEQEREAMAQRKAEISERPKWMESNLTGYGAFLSSHRDLAMSARGRQ